MISAISVAPQILRQKSRWSGMPSRTKTKLTRRSWLKATMLSGGALLADRHGIAWPITARSQETDPFAGGRRLGIVDFINEGPVPLDTPQGSELDGRLYTDLSTLEPPSAITLAEKFYIRTRVSELLPDPTTWQVKVDGLVDRPLNLGIESLKKAARPMGAHVMECAGNVRLARFALISAGNWAGVPISEILDNTKVRPSATRILISGFDRYAKESKTSVPGASWIFSLEQLNAARAFLATELNRQPLTKDHGAPLRLVVPGWYGCTCIKWVNKIALVSEDAEATSQMQEYAARTLQRGAPRLAREYQPAVIEQAAMPIRIEKWIVGGKIGYRVVGIAWGGSQPVKVLTIRFNPEEDYVPVDHFNQVKNDPWTLWTHAWSPSAPGTYMIRLAVKEPAVQARRLDSGYYVRTVEISEV
jgi:DMSO/TMAO reductase YedYZ molybdopterin-dependent catalytic subunit